MFKLFWKQIKIWLLNHCRNIYFSIEEFIRLKLVKQSVYEWKFMTFAARDNNLDNQIVLFTKYSR